MNHVGLKIEYYRKKKNMSREVLAKKSDISEISIRKYESGERNPKIETLNKIAAALGVSTDDLLKDNVINISAMSEEEKKEYIELLIEYPEFKPIVDLIENQGYKVSQEMSGFDVILTKDNKIEVKIPEKDFVDFGKKTLEFINEFSEFQVNKLLDIYKLLS